jgi:menaquinone-dependent protoporphyrinogen IX oxidase
MPKSIIVYESKWGNTRLVAENIGDGIKLGSPIEVNIKDVKNVDPTELTAYDAIVIGSPDHCGGTTRNIGNLVNNPGHLKLEGKTLAFFDTCMGSDFQKTANKLARMAIQKAPGIKLFNPVLSILVEGMKSPVSVEELAKSGKISAALLR